MSEIEKITKEIEELNLDAEENTAVESTVEEPSLKDEALEESLSVIKEVRNELAASYVQHKENTARIENLSSQVAELTKVNGANDKNIENLNKELDAYKASEEEAARAVYNKRLENLSSAFKELGQVKTVETLSALPAEVITEFESVTGLALKSRTEETLSIETVPTQAMASKKVEVKPAAQPVRTAESLSNSELSNLICKALSTEQQKEGPDSRRTVRM